MALHQQRQSDIGQKSEITAKDDPFGLNFGTPRQERSNVLSFLVGGVVIAGSLLGFLFLDSNVPAKAPLTQSDGFIRIEPQASKVPVAALRSVREIDPVTQ